MKILVIVVTYNGMPWLERCLGSVLASETPADLYVWDNDSTDGSADFVEGHFPQAKLVRSADNLGFAEGNNMGLRYALERGYHYVYLLNQDAWIEPSTLGTLVAAQQAHPEFGVLSPLQMTDGFVDYDRAFAKILRFAQNDTVRHVMAAHWLVSRECLEKVGLFAPLFPIWGNDDNYCDRVRYHGLQVGIVPEARAVHDRAFREEPKDKVILRNYYYGSLVRLCDPNRPLWERFLFVCLFTLVKTIKYGSTLPLKYFRTLCRMLPEIKETRVQA